LGEAVRPYQVLAPDGELVGLEPDLSERQLRELYGWMAFGRALDERGLALQRQGRIIIWAPERGQEAAQAGLGLAMQPGDWLFPSYREPIALCMRGVGIDDLLAYYRGLYWTPDPHATGVWPTQIVIGDQTPHAVGAGMAFRLRKEPRVAVAVIGDGATSEGDFHEGLNFAGVYGAQTVVLIQNNQWAISLSRAQQTASTTLAEKALAYGIQGLLVDGNDALAVYEACHWALEHARRGDGPVLVEALTYRLGAHTTADDPTRYQPPDELTLWQDRDPLPRLRRYLEARGLWDDAAEGATRNDAFARIDAAMARLEAKPLPDPARLFETTFAEPTARLREQRAEHEAGR
jgi:pyruvate dehydrogenase E1 component alpha subunit